MNAKPENMLHGLPTISGEILFGEPMSKHTSLGVGGPAEVFVIAESPADVQILLEWARGHSKPVFVIGAGTNLLVSDKGLRGLVLKLGSAFTHIYTQGTRLIAGASARLPAVVKQALGAELSGLEGMAGIPGSVGGAVCMNAGIPSCEIKDTLFSVKALDYEGNLQELQKSELHLAYRGSDICERGLIILEATFELHRGNRAEIASAVNRLLAERKGKQPVNPRTAGSVFKNPPGGYAGQLLESAGAKELSFGGARVSPIHANFIENIGGATAADILELIERLQRLVQQKHGIKLETEIRIVGEW
ncbi:MAG: UDP-N-acetylmuramate dehydrogenase [Armatimonadota bacterium]|nr:UDP-N-acetylmuramate dehydrogenase [Armatimonadota bacterium]